MNPDTARPPAPLERFILTLLALMGVAARFVARVLAGGDAEKRRFALLLKHFARKGYVMRYPGEDDATVQKRIDMLAWAARDPLACFRHLARGQRGLSRARAGQWAPISFAPPGMACPARSDACAVDAPAPDTS